MAAVALKDGDWYGLLANASGCADHDRTVVHVKLTDVAIRTIDEFRANKKKLMEKPTIQFYDNDGLITIPGLNGRKHEFRFSTADIKPDVSCFECIEQDQSERMLSVVGDITKKLNVMATDEVYRMTKQKMNLVEEQSRKQCAKEIDRNDPDKGRRIKKAIRPSTLTTSRGPTPPSAATSAASTPSPIVARPYQQFPASSSLVESFTSAAASRQVAPLRVTPTPSPKAPHSADRSHSPAVPLLLPGLAVANGSDSTLAPDGNLKALANSSEMNYPYRDRIIHLLAIRPYKKVELVQRLQRDGIREKDKNKLTPILQQVALYKNNVYSLLRHVFAEVRPDWPFYTDDQRRAIKRMLDSMHELPSSATASGMISSPSLSPCLSSGSSHGSPVAPVPQPPAPPQQAQKRVLVDPGINYHEPAKKQQRIAHTQKASPITVAAVHVSGGGGSRGTAPSSSSSTTATSISSHSARPKTEKKVALPAALPPVESRENFSQGTTQTDADYAKVYVQIVSADQRQRYKADFVAEYDEYKRLYGKMAERMHIFKKLKERLVTESASNPDTYEVVKLQIMEEYRRLQADAKYLIDRRRCEYLHSKLGHIKALVTDYDQQNVAALS